MDKESPEERLKKVEIQPVERECLERVFAHLGILIIFIITICIV